MTDWVTLSSLGTAGGTLVLAVATYQSVRSGNRSARVAERSLMEGVRPVLIPSREQDPVERVRFGDDIVLTVPGHGGAAKVTNDVTYLAVALRNAGSGLARLHGWRARAYPRDRQISPSSLLGDDDAETGNPVLIRPELGEFRRQQLDLFIPAGETGFWQGALRDPDEPGFAEVRDAVAAEQALAIDLLYGDQEGGQRAILRLSVTSWPEFEGRRVSVLRYWNIDRDDSR